MGSIATIGMFDGVHKGHRFVLNQLVTYARKRGLQSLAVTFDHSPRQEQVLTPLDEKLRLIKETGVDRIEVLSFTPELKALSARDFMHQVLREQLGVEVLLTGYDNRFGHNRTEGFDDYVRYGRELGLEVVGLPAEGSVSSSLIRRLLQQGHVNEAAKELGRCYTLQGHVVHGERMGTALGFPTANLVPDDPCQLVPASGVYAVRCLMSDVRGKTYKGMMNIGTRPTFGRHTQTLEVHVLDYEGDLYDQQLCVSFVSRLREERRFDSLDALKEQLVKDTIQAKQLL